MSASAATISDRMKPTTDNALWLRSKQWDLLYITFSVVLVPLPYLIYLFGVHVGGLADDFSRNLVNGFVAIAIGGPHMMSTFLRTNLDDTFKQRYPMLVRSSFIIPIVVISLAFLNLNLLLTVFFFWASMHVLHQITYIVELYNHKDTNYVRVGLGIDYWSRMIDYAIILTSIFPFAALKISQGRFDIGTNDLTSVIPGFFQQQWFFLLMTVLFGIASILYISKSIREYRTGIINWPKTIFLTFTVLISFTIPLLPNLDTAFQGLNTWHSFQYLGITFYIIKLRQHYGELDRHAPLVARFSRRSKDARGLYLLSTTMLVGSVSIFLVVYGVAQLITPSNVDPDKVSLWRFDVAYYTSILSFLWIHYYQDHFLFTDFEALDDAQYGNI